MACEYTPPVWTSEIPLTYQYRVTRKMIHPPPWLGTFSRADVLQGMGGVHAKKVGFGMYVVGVDTLTVAENTSYSI